MNKEQANFRLDAVNMFMHHIAMYGELPFKPSLPNARTLQTFANTEAGKGLTKHDIVDAIFSKLSV